MAKIKPHKFFRKKSQPEQQVIKKSRQLPSIYRFFTDKKLIGIVVLFVALFVFIGLAGAQAYRHYQEKEKVLSERKEVLAKISYWQNVVIEKKGYRDGYFQLAILWYQLGQNDKSQIYLSEALKLDPNFEEGRKLEKVLSSK